MTSSGERKRGFTMIGAAIASTMIAAVATLGVPVQARLQRAHQFRAVTRGLTAALSEAQILADSGLRAWPDHGRTEFAGLYVVRENAYALFVDRDVIRDGDEMTTRTVILPPGMVITSPVGHEIRYRPNGAAVVPNSLTLFDEARGKTRTIAVSAAGTVRIE